MKGALLILCLAFASCTALPTQVSQASVLDLLKDLEDVVQEDGKALIGKMINVLQHVENAVLHVKEVVPKVYEKIHQEADEVLAGLKEVSEHIQELLNRNKVMFGFDLLGGLTELSGGTKLGTVLKLMALADKAHRCMEDAKQFVPHLEDTLNKMQSRVESHVHDFANHVVKELGLQDVAMSIATKIEGLLGNVEEEAHILILDLLHKMEQTFDVLKSQLPEEYEKVKERVEEVRTQLHDLVVQIEKTLVMNSFSLLDLAGNVSGGTEMSTVFKVMSLVDKFNTVVQDVKNFGPPSWLPKTPTSWQVGRNTKAGSLGSPQKICSSPRCTSSRLHPLQRAKVTRCMLIPIRTWRSCLCLVSEKVMVKVGSQ